tara:strand:+ start:341 stop:505 length:165 start_codon:yes stop_codon:yes gene_type:complete
MQKSPGHKMHRALALRCSPTPRRAAHLPSVERHPIFILQRSPLGHSREPALFFA